MKACLNERRLAAIIKQYENLPAETTLSEINELLPVYAPKFFSYVGQFGVHFEGLIEGTVGKDMGHFQFRLDPCHDDESRNTRIRGIQMMDALWVGLDHGDMPAFFVGMLLASVQGNFAAYANQFSRIVPAQLDSSLQAMAEKVAFAPVAAPRNAVEAMEREQGYELWLAQSGKKDPLARFQAVEEYRQAEEAAFAAQQAEARAREWNRG